MKKNICLFLLMAFGINSNLFANDGGIEFLPTETAFEKILKKAKEEDKLIFIDAFTTWCAPCKWLDKNVFSDPEVGEFFNANFINAKIDMEKGEGIELAKKYNVRAYPSLLFINGDGELVHRFCGSSPKEQFLESAAVALNEEERLGTYINRYEAGDRDLSNMKELLLKASAACMNMEEAASEYWKLQPKEEWLSDDNLSLYKTYVRDINSDQFEYLLSDMDEFLNKEGMEDFVKRVFSMTLSTSIYKNDTEQLEADRKKIQEQGHSFAKRALAQSYVLEYQRAKDWNKFAEYASEYIEQFGINDANYINSIAWTTYQNVEDKKILEEAAGWMEQLLEKQENHNYAYTDTHAALLLKSGNIEEGTKTAYKAIEIAKAEGTDYKGTEELLEKYK